MPSTAVEYGKILVDLGKVDLDIESWFSNNILDSFKFMGATTSPAAERPRQRRRIDENGEWLEDEPPIEQQRVETPATEELHRQMGR